MNRPTQTKKAPWSINVAVVDDQDIIRVGIQQFLSGLPHITFTGGFASIHAFCHDAASARTDVLLLDDSLPFTDVFQAVTFVQNRRPNVAIILLGSRLSPADMHTLLKRGVQGFISKDEPLRDTLVTGIERVCEGKVHLSPEAVWINKQYDPSPLSPRLVQVLELIAQGLHVQQIARELDISTRAVYAARTRLREALGVQTDAQLGAEAIRRGLIGER